MLLALEWHSRMQVLQLVCVIFIETLRGIPLVAILFIASVMFLPQGMTFDKLLRALGGDSAFYLCLYCRGGVCGGFTWPASIWGLLSFCRLTGR